MNFVVEKFAGGLVVDGRFLSLEKTSSSAISDYKQYLEKQKSKQRKNYNGLTLCEALDEKKKMYKKMDRGDISQEEVRTWRLDHNI